MASSNIKIFDENKGNLMADEAYAIDTQRVNGVQSGIASSQLQNKTLFQVSLMAYALAQVMNQNGIDANDYDAVSTFVNNLSSSLLQKVNDKASTAQAQAGTDNTKWMTPALVKAWWDNMYTSFTLPVSKLTGTLPIANGGTGMTSNPSMLINLGSTSAASVFAASPRPGVTGTLPVARGGTGQTTLANLVTQLAANGVARIGTFTRSGTGEQTRYSVTLPVAPKVIFILPSGSAATGTAMQTYNPIVWGATKMSEFVSGDNYSGLTLTFSSTTITIQSGYSKYPYRYANVSGVTYSWYYIY